MLLFSSSLLKLLLILLLYKIKSICLLLGNIEKHSLGLSLQVWNLLTDPKILLGSLMDHDQIIKRNASFCICEIEIKGKVIPKICRYSWLGSSGRFYSKCERRTKKEIWNKCFRIYCSS